MNPKYRNDFRKMTGTEYKGSSKDLIQIMLMHNLEIYEVFSEI